jgi:hypothetical protein
VGDFYIPKDEADEFAAKKREADKQKTKEQLAAEQAAILKAARSTGRSAPPPMYYTTPPVVISRGTLPPGRTYSIFNDLSPIINTAADDLVQIQTTTGWVVRPHRDPTEGEQE